MKWWGLIRSWVPEENRTFGKSIGNVLQSFFRSRRRENICPERWKFQCHFRPRLMQLLTLKRRYEMWLNVYVTHRQGDGSLLPIFWNCWVRKRGEGPRSFSSKRDFAGVGSLLQPMATKKVLRVLTKSWLDFCVLSWWVRICDCCVEENLTQAF